MGSNESKLNNQENINDNKKSDNNQKFNSNNILDDKIKSTLEKNFKKNLINEKKVKNIDQVTKDLINASKGKKLIPSNESKEITGQPSKSKESSSSSVNQIIEINTPEIEGNAEINKDENEKNIKLIDFCENQFSPDEKFKLKKNDQKQENSENVKSKGGSLWQDIRKFYKFKEILSSGQFGTVRIATKRNDNINKFYAIKSISKKNLTDQDLIDLMKEVEILSCLDHPNIIKFYETYQDQQYFHLVMELCTGKEAFDKIIEEKYITELKVAQIIYKITSAICYCHSIGITHRDIKPENILFESNDNENEIKLIDFGLSRKYNKNEKMHTILGTPYYVAPEVLRGDYDQKCDIWSIGAICYIMLCGSPPFSGRNNNDIFQLILNGELKFDEKKWINISKEAIDFIKQCLSKDPDKRFSAQMALKHNWLKNVSKEIHSNIKLCKDIFYNLKNFSSKGRFKKLVLKLFLVNFLTSTEMKKLRESFQALDLSNEGTINMNGFEIACKNAGMKINDEDLKNIFKKNCNEIGEINYSEFLIGSMNEKSFLDFDKLSLAFKYFDFDENGYIDCKDLRNVLLRSGKDILHTEELESIIKEVSENKGQINFNEFLKMFEWEHK